MDMRKLLPLFVLLLFAGAASAACTNWSPAVGEVTFSTPVYSNVCIDFEWSHSRTANDFNNYIIKASGDVSLNDMNSTGNKFTLCRVAPGDSVTFNVQAFDGNAEGMFCSFDYNVTVNNPELVGSATFLVYTILLVIAGFIGTIIFIILIVWLLKALNIKLPGFGK